MGVDVNVDMEEESWVGDIVEKEEIHTKRLSSNTKQSNNLW